MRTLSFLSLAVLLATSCAATSSEPVRQKFFGSGDLRKDDSAQAKNETQVAQRSGRQLAPIAAAPQDPEAPKQMEPTEKSQLVAAQPVAPAAFSKDLAKDPSAVHSEDLAKEDAPIIETNQAPEQIAQENAEENAPKQEDTENVIASAKAEEAANPAIDSTMQDEVTLSRSAAPAPAKPTAENTAMKELFDRWEKVWHEGKYDLIPASVAKTYTRHDEYGNKTVSAEEYAKEIPIARETRPGIRFEMYDHAFSGDRAWFRFTLKWKDKKSGQEKTQAGMQQYRVEDGKLAETWLTLQKEGTAWPDKAPQTHWTSETR
jgi:hypothetical protein